MRVFIAIDPPLEVKEELRNTQTRLKGAKLRFVKDFHITLKFFGELTPEKVEHVKKQLSKADFKPYTTTLNNIGIFKGKKQIRTVWAAIKPERETLQLEQQISTLFPEYKEKRKFSAHITIARVKHINNKEQFLKSLKETRLKRIKFTINNFKLKNSTLTPEGPIYEDLGIY